MTKKLARLIRQAIDSLEGIDFNGDAFWKGYAHQQLHDLCEVARQIEIEANRSREKLIPLQLLIDEIDGHQGKSLKATSAQMVFMRSVCQVVPTRPNKWTVIETHWTSHDRKCMVEILRDWEPGTDTTCDDPKTIGLSDNEQAVFDILTDEPMLGRDILAKLAREGISNIDAPALSRICKKKQMIARGVRSRSRVGYYKIKYNPTTN